MRNLKLAMISVYAFAFVGCATAQSPVNGAFFTDVKSAGGATEAYGGSARGESCASSYLGVVALGDATIDTAKKNGGIAQVTAVDHTSNSILGLWAKYCTVVYGKKASGGAAPATPAAKPAG
jgi:predicted enzyme related to lactoylglutathione lyase